MACRRGISRRGRLVTAFNVSLPHPGASCYFRNTPDYIDEWAGKRDAAGRRPIDSTIAWRAMKDHFRLAKGRSLPVRAVVIQARGSADGTVRAKIRQADYMPDWRLKVTYFDPSTGAFELAVFHVRP